MGKHRLEGRWSHISTHNVVIFGDGHVGRVDGSDVGDVGRIIETGDPWKVGEV